jgi:hypothetical protein
MGVYGMAQVNPPSLTPLPWVRAASPARPPPWPDAFVALKNMKLLWICLKSIRKIYKIYFIKHFHFLLHLSTGIGIGRGGRCVQGWAAEGERRVQGWAAEGGIELRNK